MRFIGRALLASVFVLGACGGGEQQGAATTTTDTAAAAPAAQSTTPAATTSGAPITGTRHRVEMVMNANGEYRYVPSNITVKAGDAIDFVNVSGGPHNVAFDATKIPTDVQQALEANMPGEKMGPLMGPLVLEPNAVYTISFGGITPGTYDFHCTPHMSFGMAGTVTVQ